MCSLNCVRRKDSNLRIAALQAAALCQLRDCPYSKNDSAYCEMKINSTLRAKSGCSLSMMRVEVKAFFYVKWNSFCGRRYQGWLLAKLPNSQAKASYQQANKDRKHGGRPFFQSARP